MNQKFNTIHKNLEGKYAHFSSLSIDLHCVVGFDGKFKYLNPAWTKILGWSTQELVDKSFIEFVHPADRKHTIIEFHKLTNSDIYVKTVLIDGCHGMPLLLLKKILFMLYCVILQLIKRKK